MFKDERVYDVMPLVNRFFAAVFVLMCSAVSQAETACSFIGEMSENKILWTDRVGVAITGDTLSKINREGWNSAAFSSEYIANDGALEFTANGTSTSRMLGFAYVNTDERFEAIDYGVFLTSYGRLYIFENGIQRGNYSTYSDGDVIRIERKNSVISYLKNGNEIYLSKAPSSGNLHVDVSLYSEGATINNTRLYGAGHTTVAAEWMDLVDVEIKQNALVKSGGNGWNSGAASIQNISGNGGVELMVHENDDTMVFGLSKDNKDAGFKRIGYAIYVAANGDFYVYEDGFNKGGFGSYDKKDIFRVERQGSKVTYMRNCEPFYVSKVPSRGKLMVDVSLYSRGSRITNAIIYGVSL